jgi:hypothetical protein
MYVRVGQGRSIKSVMGLSSKITLSSIGFFGKCNFA